MGYDKIVCVEPTPSSYQQLINNFKIDENLIVLNMAITETQGEEIDFYINDQLPFLNTIDRSWITDTRHKNLIDERSLNKIKIKTTTVSEMIKNYGIPEYIKIDVEGLELSVLKSFDEKINLLSFEYIAELKDMNIKCLERCSELGYENFFISFNEELPIFIEDFTQKIGDLNMDYWKADEFLKNIYFTKHDLESAKTIIGEIKNYDTKNCIWGNIWCN